MTAADVGPATDMLRREWSDRSVFFRWALRYTPSHLYVADDAGEIVGTAIATAHGGVGWVGTIFVTANRRRSGLGARLTQTVIDDLEGRGCRTLVLIATDQGRPLYERLGFEVQLPMVRFVADGLPPADDDAIRPFEPRMLPDILAIDRRATGEDRSTLIELLTTPESAMVLTGPRGTVRGIVTTAPWAGVSLMAPEPDDAIRLLEWRRRETGPGAHASAGFPDTGAERRALLMEAGWTEAGAGTRMIRGEPIDWHPEWIWGHFNGALG
jgi:hypothetical protein